MNLPEGAAGGLQPEPLLTISDLSVRLHGSRGTVQALEAVEASLDPEQALGLVGESGAGKSTLARTLIGLAGAQAQVSGSIRFAGKELIGAPAGLLRSVRGDGIAYVGQEAQAALHPLKRVGGQIVEALCAKQPHTRGQARDGAAGLLAEAGLGRTPEIARRFPHELSGGERQRVVIAMALAGRPRLLVADEPTSALDVTVQAQIIALLGGLHRRLGMALLLIGHDLDVVAALSQQIAVIYAGRIVEQGAARQIMQQPEHPYTWGLIDALPPLDAPAGSLAPIGGPALDPVSPPSGCRFHPRCRYALPACAQVLPRLQADGAGAGHRVACLLEPRRRRMLRDSAATEPGAPA